MAAPVIQFLTPGTPTATSLRLQPWAEVDSSLPLDYHMHTVHTDGTASSSEMAEAAISRGMKEILFSEHVRHSSTYYPAFAGEIRALNYPDVTIQVGVETKVIDTEGRLDCSIEIASLCDAIVGSVHRPPPPAPQSWRELDSQAALDLEFRLAMAIATNSRAHILGHPMGMVVTRHDLMPLEQLYQLACACRDSGKAFELNTRYCNSIKDWIDVVRKAGCLVSFASDAHNTGDVGSAWHLFRPEAPQP